MHSTLSVSAIATLKFNFSFNYSWILLLCVLCVPCVVYRVVQKFAIHVCDVWCECLFCGWIQFQQYNAGSCMTNWKVRNEQKSENTENRWLICGNSPTQHVINWAEKKEERMCPSDSIVCTCVWWWWKKAWQLFFIGNNFSNEKIKRNCPSLLIGDPSAFPLHVNECHSSVIFLHRATVSRALQLRLFSCEFFFVKLTIDNNNS